MVDDDDDLVAETAEAITDFVGPAEEKLVLVVQASSGRIDQAGVIHLYPKAEASAGLIDLSGTRFVVSVLSLGGQLL